MWVRELKLGRLVCFRIFAKSHPMWVRELKLFVASLAVVAVGVAPYVGA